MSAPLTQQDRAVGAIIGSLIGDALSVGPHWYYDLDQQRADYGDWIADYLPAKEGRYHYPLEVGEVSQTGQITLLLLESLAEQGGYNPVDFTQRFDTLLETLDGTPRGGRYTDHAIRDVYRQRKAGLPWSEVGSRSADTADSAIFLAPLAARYAGDLQGFADRATQQIRFTHRNPIIGINALAWGLVVAGVIAGADLATIAATINQAQQSGALKINLPIDHTEESYKSAVPTPAKWAWLIAHNDGVKIEPASLASQVWGMACAQHYLLPAAYYLVSRFPNDFESAVLHAVNGGGHNVARASLTGALSGAMVGLSGIPLRFIEGLKHHERYLDLAQQVAEAGVGVGVG